MKVSLDQQTDYSQKELYTCLKDISLPDFVKQAELQTDLSELTPSSFADPGHRAFPINSKENVYLSNAYFLGKKASLRKLWGEGYVNNVASNIKTAAEIFEVEDALENYAKQAQVRDSRSYPIEYLYSVKFGEDEVKLFPAATKDDFIKAASTFSTSLEKYPFAWRRDISNSFVKNASKFGVDELPDIICKYAGMFYPDINQVKQHLWYRSTKLQKEANIKAYEAIQKDLDNVTSNDEIFKLAEICYYTERMEGLQNGKNILPDPVDQFFSLPVEKVAEIMNVVRMAGENYDLDDLKAIKSDIYKEAFGCDLDPSNTAQLRDVLPTMPRSDVELFREISGVAPIS